jgi:hypothetical protein
MLTKSVYPQPALCVLQVCGPHRAPKFWRPEFSLRQPIRANIFCSPCTARSAAGVGRKRVCKRSFLVAARRCRRSPLYVPCLSSDDSIRGLAWFGRSRPWWNAGAPKSSSTAPAPCLQVRALPVSSRAIICEEAAWSLFFPWFPSHVLKMIFLEKTTASSIDQDFVQFTLLMIC